MFALLNKWRKSPEFTPATTESFAFPLDKVTCDYPLWRFEIMSQGEIFHCCPTWLPHSVAKITEVSILDAFRSPLSTDIRREVQSGQFKYCEAKLCPYLSRYVNLGEIKAPIHARSQVPALNKSHSADRAKRLLLMLNYDASCNLRCPSCRNETIMFKEEEAPPLLRSIHAAVLRNIRELQEAGFELSLNITGSGDAFASPLYARLLRELEFNARVSLELQTNGVLMDEARFTPAMFQMLRFLAVSVDAATKPVYDVVRRGGSFERLLKNLDWMDSALAAGKFSHPVYYKINFIVQQENFREILSFAKWILSYQSVSEIWFNLIADWGHLPKAEFERKAIWRTEHPDHAEFLAVVRDPAMRNPRIHLGNLTSYL
jgi:molybdenum cofactor biosynthesis enzyme MoaA